MNSIATIATSNGSKYLQQLCKHWTHKFEVTFGSVAGTIPFPTSVLTLAATPDALILTITALEAATLDRMEGVVVEHLQRFAFREDLTMAWVRT